MVRGRQLPRKEGGKGCDGSLAETMVAATVVVEKKPSHSSHMGFSQKEIPRLIIHIHKLNDS